MSSGRTACEHCIQVAEWKRRLLIQKETATKYDEILHSQLANCVACHPFSKQNSDHSNHSSVVDANKRRPPGGASHSLSFLDSALAQEINAHLSSGERPPSVPDPPSASAAPPPVSAPSAPPSISGIAARLREENENLMKALAAAKKPVRVVNRDFESGGVLRFLFESCRDLALKKNHLLWRSAVEEAREELVALESTGASASERDTAQTKLEETEASAMKATKEFEARSVKGGGMKDIAKKKKKPVDPTQPLFNVFASSSNPCAEPTLPRRKMTQETHKVTELNVKPGDFSNLIRLAANTKCKPMTVFNRHEVSVGSLADVQGVWHEPKIFSGP